MRCRTGQHEEHNSTAAMRLGGPKCRLGGGSETFNFFDSL